MKYEKNKGDQIQNLFFNKILIKFDGYIKTILIKYGLIKKS
jgi:hypothetical protein